MPLPRDVGVLLVAAGQGLRAGGETPKQYLEVAGVPMLLRALRPFLRHPAVAKVVVALPPADVTAPPPWLAELAGDAVMLVPGGATRQASVRRALAALDAAAELVLVHDAARPFVPDAVIDAVIAAARHGGAAVPGVPETDTLKQVGADACIERTVAREALWRAQTPQGFSRALLEQLHVAADADDATDDAALAERHGLAVRIVPGSSLNFKVTTPDDVRLAEAWALSLR